MAGVSWLELIGAPVGFWFVGLLTGFALGLMLGRSKQGDDYE